MPRIELVNISKRFGGFTAVDNLNMVIEDRSFITLLGPSGCGKTTTLRMIAGLETPTEGEIIIDGQKVFSSKEQIDVSPARRNAGFLFQNYALWPHMTVFQNIAFGLENLRWDKSRIKGRVEELLGLLRISEFAGRYPAELSGGQQQRVAIARTLATSPRVLLMDEPLSNLDAKLRMDMRTELKRLHLETESTFIYVTHDQLEAMTLSTRICLLNKGLLQQYDRPLGIYNRPVNIFTADFVGSPAINLLPFTVLSLEGAVIHLEGDDMELDYHVSGVSELNPGDRVILGLRPEFAAISESSAFRAQVYSSLPSGMETIVRFKTGKGFINSVVFGSLDFPVGSKLGLSFSGENILLFEDSGALLCAGRAGALRSKLEQS
ncbi:MAG: ABC transporter ATP-binding protein [Treponema sp.]|jgi:multiple sugar transport system ATP-binding protein|nr:ABC transporter ATP-binding protein [Treponema sp.]